MRRHVRAAACGLGMGVALLLGTAGPASAKLTGPCSGTGTFEKLGATIDPATTDKATLPASDSVAYQGSIRAADPENRRHSGYIELKLPPPLPKVQVTDWGTESTDAISDSGTYDYDLPFIVPRGVTLNLEGEHVDTAGTCAGSMEIEIEGGPFDAPLPTVLSLLGTVGFGAGLFVAGKVR